MVETLQFLKFIIKWDLFFQFDPSIATDEMQEEEVASDLNSEADDKNVFLLPSGILRDLREPQIV